ncbi:NUDIX hydrolase [Luteolibacter marinus]|uniref:NUDIX hydrolase n=1 Tax=Luteolibacter marinus TaxID=2776705 RepID=UPI0031BBC889
MNRDLLAISRELKSMAEAGLRYSEGPYDLERYRRLHEIASELLTGEAREFRWPVEFGYATPKVDVRAAVIDDGKILLVREAGSGQWTLPGGWADLNESPAGNAAKEVREEAGIEVEVVKLIACWDKDRQGHPRQPEHVYKLVFLCRPNGTADVAGDGHETDGAGFFASDALPELCPFRAAPHYVELAFAHVADPGLPTMFD